MGEMVDELVRFLLPESRPDLKKVAVDNLVGLSACSEGRVFFCEHEKLIEAVINLVDDEIVGKDVYVGLVNLSSDDELAEKLVKIKDGQLIKTLLEVITRRKTSCGDIDTACKILNNLSRHQNSSRVIYELTEKLENGLMELFNVFMDQKFKHEYQYLSGVFCNFSQLPEMRNQLLEKNSKVLRDLVPYTVDEYSEIRKEGIVAMIRNVCFDTDLHEELLKDDTKLLIYLLLPLMGSEDAYDDEDMSNLPLDLQYLGDTKRPDLNSKVRKMILEALTQLCATKQGRKILREKNVYLVLRELHKWEMDPAVKMTCENLVQILIGDEPEQEFENLKEVDIPSDLVQKFKKMDSLALEEAAKEKNTVKERE